MEIIRPLKSYIHKENIKEDNKIRKDIRDKEKYVMILFKVRGAKGNISPTKLICLNCFGKFNKPEVDSSQPLDIKQEGGNGVPPTPKECGYPA